MDHSFILQPIPRLQNETSRAILAILLDFLLFQHAERFAREDPTIGTHPNRFHGSILEIDKTISDSAMITFSINSGLPLKGELCLVASSRLLGILRCAFISTCNAETGIL